VQNWIDFDQLNINIEIVIFEKKTFSVCFVKINISIENFVINPIFNLNIALKIGSQLRERSQNICAKTKRSNK
jgi:chloramphenicol O-acetyltransferase